MHLILYHYELNAMVMLVTSKGTRKDTILSLLCLLWNRNIMRIGVRKTCKEYVKQFIVAIRMDRV